MQKRFPVLLLYLVFLAVSILPLSLWAQEVDSTATKSKGDLQPQKTDSSVVYYYYDDSPFSYDQRIVLDTTLKDFQRYDPLKKDYDIVANTTIVGGPHKNLSFVTKPNPIFSIGQENLFAYLITPARIKHYTPYIPYSEVAYTMGSEEENLLRVTLGNQLSERLYIGLDFDVETTYGLFTNQRVSSNQFEINGAFETFDKRYGVYVNYIRNKFKFGENGGLTDDYYYEDTTVTDRQILAVNLDYATNTFKDNHFILNQYLTLGGTPTDTTGMAKLGRLFLNMDYTESYRIYEDQDTSFYKHYYLDSLQTFDSVNSREYHTAFGWTNDLGLESQHFGVRALVNYNYSEYYDGDKKYFFNYVTPQMDVFIRSKMFYTELSGKYRIKLDNSSTINIGDGDLFFNGKINFDIFGKKIFTGADFYNVSPMLKAWHYYSNHYMWDQTMHKQTTLNIYAGMDIRGYKARVELVNLNNYTYFDENVMPQQYSGSIALLKIRVKKRFKLRKFGASVMGLYQTANNEQYLRVPTFTGRGSIYFTFPLFKGALYVHPGFELTYLTSYYADTYNPALMQYHIQNDKKVDDQVYANFFINFKIKRARIFVAYNHFNTLWGKYNYFLTAHYPQQDAALKFGLSWRFYK